MTRAVIDDRSERSPTRTCIGCGARGGSGGMLRMVFAEGAVEFDMASRAPGRGAHLHARPECLRKAPRTVGRALRRDVHLSTSELASRLLAACDRRIVNLLLSARRLGALAMGAQATEHALSHGAPIALVAVDVGAMASSADLGRVVGSGRAIAWGTASGLGALFGKAAVDICAVRHAGIAAELKRVMAAADAGTGGMREGAGWRRPEAR